MTLPKEITLTLPCAYVGQMVFGLAVIIEQWDATAEYLTHGSG